MPFTDFKMVVENWKLQMLQAQQATLLFPRDGAHGELLNSLRWYEDKQYPIN